VGRRGISQAAAMQLQYEHLPAAATQNGSVEAGVGVGRRGISQAELM
jgi:hypothetical protein